MMTASNFHENAGSAGDPFGITRREAVRRVMALMGGVALVGEERLFALAVDEASRVQASAHGVGMFTAADVALLDEVAETILPQTSTPGAKAAKTGAFMALMVTDAYSDRDQRVFRDGMRLLEEVCRAATGKSFMHAAAAERLTLLEALDREQKTAMEERTSAGRARYPPPPQPDDQPAHYFRMMKELALLGFFTSEIGYTQAMQYRETPGRYDPDVPYAPGEKTWAPHS